MPTALHSYIERHGSTLELGHRCYTIEGISGDAETAVATLRAARATYTAILCTRTRVIGRPQAEAWTILGPRGRTIASFAIDNDTVIHLH